MSTTTTKRDYATALEDAEAFRALFPPSTYRRWEFAGSLRRQRPEVGDIEHVIEPAVGDVERGDGLFTIKEPTNLLWHHLDALLRGGHVTKHVYGATGFRWGERYRGVDYRGFNHELFKADADNWGAILLIRTGPADYSERFVTRLKSGGMYRQQDGYVIHVASGRRVKVDSEERYFGLVGAEYVAPRFRK